MSSSKPRPLLPKLVLSQHCTIADTASITGSDSHTVTIHDKAVLHPRCKITATYSSVTLSEGVIVNEKATIGLLTPLTPLRPAPETDSAGSASESTTPPAGSITIGRNVVVDIAASVHADIGEGTTVGVGAVVHPGARVGKFCSIPPRAEISSSAILPDHTLYISPSEQRVHNGALDKYKVEAHEKNIEMLRRLIPMNREKWLAT